MSDFFTDNNKNCPSPLYPQDSATPNEGFQSYFTQESPGNKTIYKTPKQTLYTIICLWNIVLMSISYGVLTYIYISQKDKYVIYAFVGITIFGIILMLFGGLGVFYTWITIDRTVGIFSIKKKKLCCCFSKTKEYKIDDLKKIIIEREYKTYSQTKTHFTFFTVEILLQNNLMITLISNYLVHNNESLKAFNILRNSLPDNIEIEYI